MIFVLRQILFVFFTLAVLSVQAAQAVELSATSLAVTGDAIQTRVEMQFTADPQVQMRLLANPHRLVLDLPQTLFAFENREMPNNSMVASLRAGMMQEGRSRMILTLKGPFKLEGVETAPTPDGSHFALSFNLKPEAEATFQQNMADSLMSTASTAGGKGDRVVQGDRNRLFTVVIDPGHGGIDSGAVGVNGTAEKDVTLRFSKDLADILRQNTAIKVFLTREDDRFIALDERVRSARQLGGDLFVSIHADSINDKHLRGATVYTLSDKASDEVAQAVAHNENLSDAIGGVDVPVEDHAVADILIDLTRRETMQYSVGFARQIVDVLKAKTNLINNSHRSAGFRVLKAADIPSVLIELGYLSNEQDERQIADDNWRKLIAAELAKAIGIQANMTMAARQ